MCAFLPLGTAAAGVHPARGLAPPCRLARLTLARGPDVSPATGQNPLALRLTNRARGACALKGYPALEFVDERGVIPFVIRHGGDQMVTTRRPTRLDLRPGGSAFVVLNKYRCDTGTLRMARRLRIGLPGAVDRRSLRLPAYPRLGYCGVGDPGSTVATSPFELSLRAALRQH